MLAIYVSRGLTWGTSPGTSLLRWKIWTQDKLKRLQLPQRWPTTPQLPQRWPKMLHCCYAAASLSSEEKEEEGFLRPTRPGDHPGARCHPSSLLCRLHPSSLFCRHCPSSLPCGLCPSSLPCGLHLNSISLPCRHKHKLKLKFKLLPCPALPCLALPGCQPVFPYGAVFVVVFALFD